MNYAYHHLAASLPEPLEPLAELATDLRWSWSHESDELWARVDPVVWEATRNPYVVVRGISPERIEELMADRAFMRRLDELVASRKRYLDKLGPIGTQFDEAGVGQVAYFSMEFGLGKALPLYAGGLGILAGDYLKSASDLGAPVVGIGLLYQQGYFRQLIDSQGCQQAVLTYNDPFNLPVIPARRPSGELLTVTIRLPGRRVRLRVWEAQVGRVRLYLLDSNDPINSAVDRGITGQLYGGGQEMRLVQEIALGVGGWAVIEVLGIDVDVCHLNEGHAAFATLERIRTFMQHHDMKFWDALWATRAGNVFTTHTSVAAAFDAYKPDLLAQYGSGYAGMLGLEDNALLRLGQSPDGSLDEPFRMAWLAARTCGAINGVSELHGKVSREIFAGLYPRWPRNEVPVTHVTNGVHVPTWDSPWSDKLWTKAAGKERWRAQNEDLAGAVESLSDAQLWKMRANERADLIQYARQRLSRHLAQRGADERTVERMQRVLDPNVLTVGFARRFTDYKRNNLLLRDEARLTRLLTHPERPVQLVVAGKAHPADKVGQEMIRHWTRFAQRSEVRQSIAFLEDYDMALAQELVQGVDLWLNTPRPPWEACGTSGMKVLVNGGLNASSLDGWWAEAYDPSVGWVVGADGSGSDQGHALALYELLENEIVPEFYRRNTEGVATGWVARMRASMVSLVARFSSNRMLGDYVNQLYLPAARAYKNRAADGAQVARDLRRWSERLRARWHELRWGDVEIDGQGDQITARAQVYLGEIQPDDVAVELYAESGGGDEPARIRMVRGAPLAGAANGFSYEAKVSTVRPASHFTPRVVPFHPAARAPAELRLIFWHTPAQWTD